MAGWGNHRNNRATAEDMLDRENQERTDNLAGKVSRLKLLALDMELETQDQNRYMNGMDTDFDSATGLLSGSMKRVTHMVGAAGSNRRLMCYLILGLVGGFVLIYYIVLSFHR
ncbi:BET1-like protein [Lamellibrachia satsuma]|nr:BET1-like protein [Lamellibrachia satsuma]